MLHHHPARVARETPRRFSGHVCAVLEDGLPGLIGIREGWGIDVDHHLVSLCRSAGINAVVEGCLREQRESVGLLLRHRRRFRGTQHVAFATPRPTETEYASRVRDAEVAHVSGVVRARRGT